MNYISFPTAMVAGYFNTTQAAITASVRRYGQYKGIEPFKDAAGRYHWPADLVRAAALPPEWEQPEGAPRFVEYVSRLAPGIEPVGAYRVALALLGSGAKAGWKPMPAQTPEIIQHEEIPLAFLILQATLDRVDTCVTADLDKGVQDFARVLSRRLALFGERA